MSNCRHPGSSARGVGSARPVCYAAPSAKTADSILILRWDLGGRIPAEFREFREDSWKMVRRSLCSLRNSVPGDNLREFACLTAVILAPLRVEWGLHGRSATPPRRRKPRTQFLYYGGILPPKSHRSIGIESAGLNSYTTVGLGRQNSAPISP